VSRTSLREGDPARIGPYRLTARLGSGGMGVVYLGVARDGGLVAVKVLRPELADDPDFRRRFDREVAVLMRVRGVCTVEVIEADTESLRPFMVTEYADGPSLAEYIDMYGPLSAEMLYGLATGLAEALTVIHAAGIVHRDLKPSNVILTQSGPKVIDFGIAQTLDATSVTGTGMMVGSAGFMAPEQVTGRPGPAADIFVWGVTIGYAAAGHSPFGTGDTNAILYRVLYADPDIAAVPEPLKPMVEAALAKDPQSRPAAHELLDRLTSTSMRPALIPHRLYDTPTQTVLARTWQETGPHASQPPANGSLLLAPAAASTRPGRKKVSRRVKVSASAVALVLAAGAALIAFVLPGHSPKAGPLAGDQGQHRNLNPVSSTVFPPYPGQQQRGVFQQIDRIVSAGDTMVTTGSQSSAGSPGRGKIVRQQFFRSTDGGSHWDLAPVHTPSGGQPPLGYQAVRIAGGAHGWMAEGPNALWTSPDGRSWTLAATHGITPQEHGGSIDVVTNTADGFLAGGQQQTGGQKQAGIWVSHDGVSWQRLTASQLALTASGGTPQNIAFATSRGNDTLIAGGGSVWLSTDGGSAWTLASIPVDHGAADSISGVSFDGSGLIAVRPGRSASGTPDGLAYFSPNGHGWHYAGTIDAAGGWTPGAVKGSDYGFVVTGSTTAGHYVAYTSTGTGSAWRPTGVLGDTSSGPALVATVGPGSNVVAVGSMNSTKISQQAVFIEANTTGKVSPVPLTSLAGGVIPEIAVNSTAIAGRVQIAVGSADGYPAVWRKASSGSWTLISTLSLVSGTPGLAQLTNVTHGSHGWFAIGTPGPVILTSADGATWQAAGGSIAHSLAGVASVAAAAGPDGYVIVGSHDDKPVVWTTTDGRAWTERNLPLPSGASAGVMDQVAIDGNRVVAMGQQTTAAGLTPLVEMSANGGDSWRQVPFISTGPGTTITALTGDSGGFTAAAQYGAPGGELEAVVWTSPDGASWTQSSVHGLTGGGSHDITALATSGSAVTGIDSVQTQAGQQFVTRPLG
jgi:serine/threonine protein kinase